MTPIIDSLRIGPEKNFCYLILCPKTHQAALIDPSFEFDRVIKWVKSKDDQAEIAFLIATHGHWDHAGGFPEMLQRVPNAKVVCSLLEESRLRNSKIPVHLTLDDQEVLQVGDFSIRAVLTPGHTEGGCCYVVNDQLFSGDTLFIGQCGRTDMPGGSDEVLYESLQKIKRLPKTLMVRPGHDYGRKPMALLSEELEKNPTLMAKNLEEFKALP